MKPSLCLLYILFCLSVTLSCTNEEPESRQTALTKDEALHLIQSQYLYVTKIERKVGNETVDLTYLPEFNVYRKGIFFLFRQGFILILTGNEILNFPHQQKRFFSQTKFRCH
ncbi:hypothetical protein [Dyadobacter sp. 3J3]|uniref:hypothetical protein n=1 Tax=Dyadobacter sp. 3J3 TaxID=2606600 RepID=UPI0013599CB6|nr:hypothetical protein [Dyadobacter sp. 3J3]